jgi:DNA-binding IclR family transcriptional regulator
VPSILDVQTVPGAAGPLAGIASPLEEPALRDHPNFASTLANGLDVLGCFSGTEPTLGNKDIAERLGLSKPTVSRLTFTLVALGYLRRERRTGKYMLGPAVLPLGYPLLSQLTIRQVAAEEMLELSRLARGPVSVGARDRLQVVYVETAGAQTNATKPGIGSTRPILRTAMGRALLRAHPTEERLALERRLQQSMPQEWEQYAPGLARCYDEVDQRGFCLVAHEWRQTLAAVAAPMKAPLHGLHLAFSVTVPSYADEAKDLESRLGPRLVELVRRIEAMLGL